MPIIYWQWIFMIAFGLLFLFISPFVKTATEFYKAASKSGRAPGTFMLTSSVVIAWIMAKSITNAANLGLEYGIVGGVAYACYYLSFLTGGIILYKLRVKGKFSSLHHFLGSKYGKGAVLLFTIVLVFRLYNEVWSNTMVIGSYFGAEGTRENIIAVLLFTALIVGYTLKGGMRTSLVTDAIQMVFFGALLFILLLVILPQCSYSPAEYVTSGSWTMEGGVDLILTALIQIFSYPFHDPILTDRAFMSSPKVTLRSYVWATVVGFGCILLFSFIGIFAQFSGFPKGAQASVEVSKMLGAAVMLMMNLIMITSAASCIDSTFTSFAKLTVIDVGKAKTALISKGRWAMIAIAVLGNLPVFYNASILSATTISGTMVIGLAPVFLFWNRPMPKASFMLSVGAGIVVGLLYTFKLYPNALVFGKSKHAALLSVNAWGTVLCFVVFFLPLAFRHGRTRAVA